MHIHSSLKLSLSLSLSLSHTHTQLPAAPRGRADTPHDLPRPAAAVVAGLLPEPGHVQPGLSADQVMILRV